MVTQETRRPERIPRLALHRQLRVPLQSLRSACRSMTEAHPTMHDTVLAD